MHTTTARDKRRSPIAALGCAGLLALLVLAEGVAAQPGIKMAPPGLRPPPRRTYIELPFQDKLEPNLEDLLKSLKGRELFEELLEKIRQDPQKFLREQPKLDDIDIENPLVKQRIEDLLQRQDVQKLLPPDQAKAFDEILKKKLEPPRDLPQPIELPPDQQPVEPPPDAQPPPGNDGEPPMDQDFEQRLLEWLEGVDASWLHDLVKDSPAFQQAILDLRRDFLEQRGLEWVPPKNNWGELGQWKPPQLDISKLELKMPKLPNWSLPSLPSLPQLSVPAPRLDGAQSMRFPNLGSLGGSSIALAVVLGTILAALIVYLLWQAAKRGGLLRRGRKAAVGWQLGTWPIEPEQIRTRAELVLAFDYLTLLRFGQDAQSWHHREVAAHLPSDAELLAALYEYARYAPEDGELPSHELAQARRQLRQLAGAAPA